MIGQLPVLKTNDDRRMNDPGELRFSVLSYAILNVSRSVLRLLWDLRWLNSTHEVFEPNRTHLESLKDAHFKLTEHDRSIKTLTLHPDQWNLLNRGEIHRWDLSLLSSLLCCRLLRIPPHYYIFGYRTRSEADRRVSKALQSLAAFHNRYYGHVVRTNLSVEDFLRGMNDLKDILQIILEEVDDLCERISTERNRWPFKYFECNTAVESISAYVYRKFKELIETAKVYETHRESILTMNEEVQRLRAVCANWDRPELRLKTALEAAFPVYSPPQHVLNGVDQTIPGLHEGMTSSGPVYSGTASSSQNCFELHFKPENISTNRFNQIRKLIIGSKSLIDLEPFTDDFSEASNENCVYIGLEPFTTSEVLYFQHLILHFDSAACTCTAELPVADNNNSMDPLSAPKVSPPFRVKYYERGIINKERVPGIAKQAGCKPFTLAHGSEIFFHAVKSGKQRTISIGIFPAAV